MEYFKSYKEFKNAFEEKAKKSLNTNVKDFVTGEIQKRIRHDVYNVYEPTAYNRTEGLFDLSNYHYTLSGNTDN